MKKMFKRSTTKSEMERSTPVLLVVALLTLVLTLILQQLHKSAFAMNNLSLNKVSGPVEGNEQVTISGQEDFFVRKKIIQVSSGNAHSLALDDNGVVYSWGGNSYGQLGDGTNANSSSPIVINNVYFSNHKIVQIASGMYHSYALDSEGKLYAWGQNTNGQLGCGNNIDSNIPIEVLSTGVLDGISISYIASGWYHGLALSEKGEVYSWGRNTEGNLGNNSTSSSNSPAKVFSLGDLSGKLITQVSAGRDHSLAIDSDGKLYAWGGNGYGQLGNNSTTRSRVPIAMPDYYFGGKALKEISANALHSLALDVDGNVYSWGWNAFGQLGDSTNINSKIPKNITSFGDLNSKNIASVSAGGDCSYAIDSNGIVYSWGHNVYGQLGDTTSSNNNTPKTIHYSNDLRGSESTKISANYHALVLTTEGRIIGMGNNSIDQVTNSNDSKIKRPLYISSNSEFARTITSITFDGVEALSFNVVDGKTIEVVTPPHAAGKVDVVITADDGAVWTITQGYEYVDNSSPEQPTSEVPEEEVDSKEIVAPNTGYHK